MEKIDTQDVPARKNPTRKLWLVAAAVAFVAAFFFQWKNGVDQASIAQTDSGAVVRALADAHSEGYRVLCEGEGAAAEKISEILLCDGRGNVLCALARDAERPELFRVPADAPREKIAAERFPRLVVPALRSDEGRPVVLVVENVFRK